MIPSESPSLAADSGVSVGVLTAWGAAAGELTDSGVDDTGLSTVLGASTAGGDSGVLGAGVVRDARALAGFFADAFTVTFLVTGFLRTGDFLAFRATYGAFFFGAFGFIARAFLLWGARLDFPAFVLGFFLAIADLLHGTWIGSQPE